MCPVWKRFLYCFISLQALLVLFPVIIVRVAVGGSLAGGVRHLEALRPDPRRNRVLGGAARVPRREARRRDAHLPRARRLGAGHPHGGCLGWVFGRQHAYTKTKQTGANLPTLRARIAAALGVTRPLFTTPLSRGFLSLLSNHTSFSLCASSSFEIYSLGRCSCSRRALWSFSPNGASSSPAQTSSRRSAPTTVPAAPRFGQACYFSCKMKRGKKRPTSLGYSAIFVGIFLL